ncbi:MAG: transglutaminase domain-containing protein, partial [Planctomycetes bacterium]|nr:transglutaminase domain-containing protein [Planctomycetota bacterium]
ELDGADIRAHIDSALAMRTARGMEIPNVVFEEGLLPCRIEREPGRAWRADIEFLRKGETPRESLDACIQNWTTRIKEVEGGLFGPRLDPGQVWRLGLGTESDSKVGLVGYLRCQGFPARYSHGKVEAWVDEWLPVDMAAGRVQATAGEEGGTRGRLGLSITRGGATFEGAESYRHFNVARLQEGYLETPWWDPALGEQDWDVGAHILCSANRVPGGSIFARLRRFEVRKGETVRVTLPIDIGPGWDPGDRFFSGPDPAAFQSALAAAGLDRASSQFVFMAPAGEPCDRMLTSLEEVVDRLRAMESAPNLRFLFVGATAETPVPETLLDSLKTLGIESIESISEPTARALLGSETIDPLAGLRFGGEWIYLRAGFDTAVGSNLHWALDLSGR